jgi:ATP-dependent RNA helicase SUPV3L1/SUV3
MPPRLTWRGERVAALRRGRDALNPRIELDRSLDTLAADLRAQVHARLQAWADATKGRHLQALTRLEALKDGLSQAARGLVVQLTETMGSLPRASVASLLASLTREDRRALAQAGVRLGVTHVYALQALRPEATRWRLALWGVANGVSQMPPPPRPGLTSLRVEGNAPPGFYAVAGFWAFRDFAVRVDMADRTARLLHAQRLASRAGGGAFHPEPSLVTSLGLGTDEFEVLMAALGFRGGKGGGFAFAPARQPATRGKNRAQNRAQNRALGQAQTSAAEPASNPASAFANLGALLATGRETR